MSEAVGASLPETVNVKVGFKAAIGGVFYLSLSIAAVWALNAYSQNDWSTASWLIAIGGLLGFSAFRFFEAFTRPSALVLERAGFRFRKKFTHWNVCTRFAARGRAAWGIVRYEVYISDQVDPDTGQPIVDRHLPGIFELDVRSLTDLMNSFSDRAKADLAP